MQRNMIEIIGRMKNNSAIGQTILSKIPESIVEHTAAIIPISHAERNKHPVPARRKIFFECFLSGKKRGIKYFIKLLFGISKYDITMMIGIIKVIIGSINLFSIFYFR